MTDPTMGTSLPIGNPAGGGAAEFDEAVDETREDDVEQRIVRDEGLTEDLADVTHPEDQVIRDVERDEPV